jgi:hypothetical protein
MDEIKLASGFNMNSYNLLYIPIVAAAFVIYITMGLTDPTALAAFRASYIIVLTMFISMCALIVSNINFSGQEYSGFAGFFKMLIKLLKTIFPFVTIIVVILWILILLYKYYDRITENKVSDYYTTFINLTSFLLFIQIYILTNEITEKSFINFSLKPKVAALLKLLGLLDVLSAITLGVVLKYYITDC